MKNFTIDQHIATYKNYFEESFCKEAISLFEDVKGEQLTRDQYWTREEAPLTKVWARDTSIELTSIIGAGGKDGERAKKIVEYTFKKLSDAYYHYQDNIMIPRHDFLITCFKIQKTLPGEGYHVWHSEYPNVLPGNWKETEDCTPGGIPNVALREGVYTLYLNDIEEGGETEFLNQSVRVSPTTGTVTIFPAGYTHLHRGNPPLKGVKYIMTGWYNIMDLYGMDTPENFERLKKGLKPLPPKIEQ